MRQLPSGYAAHALELMAGLDWAVMALPAMELCYDLQAESCEPVPACTSGQCQAVCSLQGWRQTCALWQAGGQTGRLQVSRTAVKLGSS